MKALLHKLATAIWVVLGLFFFLCMLGASYSLGGWPGVVIWLVACGFLGWSQTDKRKKPEAPARATGATDAPASASAVLEFQDHPGSRDGLPGLKELRP